MSRHELLLCLAMFICIHTTDGAVRTTTQLRNTFLIAHNRARRAERANIPNLRWSTNMENKAKMIVNKCRFQHTPSNIRRWGENLYYSTGRQSTVTAATRSVQLWVNEKRFNRDKRFSCLRSSCGHYTQVIWKNTRYVGCAVNYCNNLFKTFVACAYDPPGNYIGQKPY